MAVNGFLTFFDKADGESTQKGKERWVEIQGWDWEIEAETSWTKGGGASVGKPNPGRMTWEHTFDTASTVIMGRICTGTAFPKVELQMTKTSGGATPETYFTMVMDGVFITRVSINGTEEGRVMQRVEMVFKTVKIDYKPQDARTGKLGAAKTFSWDIPAGTASPSA
ncbi:MAG: Hcp family type VI secretion system effector [Acidimicrobiia bacterium]